MIIVDRSEFASALKLARACTEKESSVPVLRNVRMRKSGTSLELAATDLEIATAITIDCRGNGDFCACVPAGLLCKSVAHLSDGEVRLSVKKDQRLEIAAGDITMELAGMSPESFPELPVEPHPMTSIPATMLASMIAKVAFAVSAEETRFTLNSALLYLHGSSVTMVATDGHRLALVECANPIGSDMFEFKALLPKAAMRVLRAIANGATQEAGIEFSADENYLFFRVGRRLFTSRKPTENFPNYKEPIPTSFAHSIEFNVAKLGAAIEFALIFADQRSHRVSFLIRSCGIEIEAGDDEKWRKCHVGVDGVNDKTPLTILLNGDYVLDAIRALGTETGTLNYGDPQQAVCFRPSGVDGETQLVMPMRG